MDERILVKQAKRGDVQAFGKLYEGVYRSMYQYAYFVLGKKEDAEDVVSQTVMEAFAQIKGLRKDEAFRSWMFAILSNQCKRKLQGYGRKRSYEIELTEEYELVSPDDLADQVEGRIDLEDAIRILEQEERMILFYNVIFGYTTKEIAAALQMNENTVRSKKSRSLAKLQLAMKQTQTVSRKVYRGDENEEE